jgi:integrase
MLQRGIHPKIVSERLGHSSIGITLDTYSHVLPSMQEEAARAADTIFGMGAKVQGGPPSMHDTLTS